MNKRTFSVQLYISSRREGSMSPTISIAQLLNDDIKNEEYDITRKYVKAQVQAKGIPKKTNHPKRRSHVVENKTRFKNRSYCIWTGSEHFRFLVGYVIHDRSWSKISELVPGKCPQAVQSHAQKVSQFLKLFSLIDSV